MAFGDFDLREPGIDAYAAGLDAAQRRWNEQALEIEASPEIQKGSFDAFAAVISQGMMTIPGIGDYEGWSLSALVDPSPGRAGSRMHAPGPAGGGCGPTVGFVVPNRDGTWTACHDPYNNRPGVTPGCTGTRVRVPSGAAAHRYVVVMQTRHEKARSGR